MNQNPYTLPADVRSFIPHRDAMLLINSLDIVEPDTGKASAIIRRENIFYEPLTGLNPVAFVELIAQTAAAHNGYMDLMHKSPIHPGFLAAIKDFHTNGIVKEGDSLHIHIQRVLEINNATVLEGRVESENGAKIAAGTLNLWIFDEVLLLPQERGNEIPVNGKLIPSGIKLGKNRDAVSSYITDHIRIQKADEAMLAAGICFAPDFVGFKGHFPNSPILPGIITLQVAVVSTEILLKNRICLKKVDKTKFLQPALPNQWVNIECTIHKDEKGQYSRVQFSADNHKIASVMLHFEEI